jgi:hypothetical protein
MRAIDFSDSSKEKRPKRRRSWLPFSRTNKRPILPILISLSLVSLILTVTQTFGARITLGSSASVEFGQGLTQTTNCTVGDFLTVTPNSGFSNGGSSGSFDLTSFTLSHIPSTCWNKNFLFQAYDSSGNLLAIDNAATSLSATYQGASTSGSGDITGASGEQTSDATSGGYYGAFTITIASPVATTTSVNRVVVQSDSQLIPHFDGNGIFTNTLELALNANNHSSYSGSGTSWFDLSGNGNNFSVSSNAFMRAGSDSDRNYMKFWDSNGCATSTTDGVPLNQSAATFVLVTRIGVGSGDWRTLTRGSYHEVIINSGDNQIGYYQNGYYGSGFDVTSLPKYNTNQWTTLYFRFQDHEPFWTMSADSQPGVILATANNYASDDSKFRWLGGLGGGQLWGDIAAFYSYNSVLSDQQLLQDYHALNN